MAVEVVASVTSAVLLLAAVVDGVGASVVAVVVVASVAMLLVALAADVVITDAFVGHAQCKSPVFDTHDLAKVHAGSEQAKNVPSLHRCPPFGGT